MITKSEFEILKKKCPWFYRLQGQPKCMAQSTNQHYLRHCAIKNCAIVYWVDKLIVKDEK